MPQTRNSGEQSADSRKEIIILVIGATGAGKSTFVNYLVQDEQQKSQVGHKLTSCTSELHPITLTFPNDSLLKQYMVTLVDAPGFDDTSLDDTTILQRITCWLENAYLLFSLPRTAGIKVRRFSGA
ncbi:hypothetical protein CPC08DRAFT_132010 [Agrocybe pediades]|nr:hypothetical protein CPC08DRAFT_132010 [Agrocybe pediades]